MVRLTASIVAYTVLAVGALALAVAEIGLLRRSGRQAHFWGAIVSVGISLMLISHVL